VGRGYYLLGYSVECALKACIAKQFLLHDVPDKKLVNSFYTHRLDDLLAVSGLKPAMDAQRKADQKFDFNWYIVLNWSETARYEVNTNEKAAKELYDAVTNAASGILPWMKIQY
jgi:hypothetical protein